MTERRRRVRIPARIEAGTDNDAATTATRRRRRDEAHGSPSCCHSRCSLSCTPKRSQSLQPQPRCRSRPGGEVRIEAGTDDTRRPALVACVDTSLWTPMWILVWMPMWIHLWKPRDDAAASGDDEPTTSGDERRRPPADDGDGDRIEAGTTRQRDDQHWCMVRAGR